MQRLKATRVAVRASTSLPRAWPRASLRIGSAGAASSSLAACQLGQRCLSSWAPVGAGGRPIDSRLVRPAIARVRAPALAHVARMASDAAADASATGAAADTTADSSTADASTKTEKGNTSGAAYARRRSGYMRTILYALHVAKGANMAVFANYLMPITYADQTLAESHAWTRTQASVFDVSHMVSNVICGRGATAFLEHITPADISAMKPYQNKLTTLMTSDGSGGIVDDMMVTRLANRPSLAKESLAGVVHRSIFSRMPSSLQSTSLDTHDSNAAYLVITNGSTRDKIKTYFEDSVKAWNEKQSQRVFRRRFERHFIMALQGPKAEAVLAEILEPDETTGQPVDLKSVRFGESFCGHIKIKDYEIDWDEIKVEMQENGRSLALSRITEKSGKEVKNYDLKLLITRGGYTGEDGFEIHSFMSLRGPSRCLAEKILAAQGGDCVRLAGLGARDSLRLEAGLCLYGNDMDETTTPVEAGLTWTIPKARRVADAGYLGAEHIAKQLSGEVPVERRRVGLMIAEGGAPARQGAVVRAAGGGEELGKVTSGSPSPTLGRNIAMAYVPEHSAAPGTELEVVVREKPHKATVTKMPFVPTKYYKGQK